MIVVHRYGSLLDNRKVTLTAVWIFLVVCLFLWNLIYSSDSDSFLFIECTIEDDGYLVLDLEDFLSVFHKDIGLFECHSDVVLLFW